jgi:uncharacterized protein YyaL (SSP411 family)
MAEHIRFSPRPNRADEIGWRSWGPEALREAAAADRPIFLNISTVWCHWCHLMDETVFSDESVIGLIDENFIPVRVDGDRQPHVQDRYIAGGWPTNAFLTPTGEALWAATFVEAEVLRGAALGVLTAWRDRREEFQLEIERRRRALESSRKRQMTFGLVRREAADDVLTAARDAFDQRNGGFGTSPKFPAPRAIELLYLHARTVDPVWSDMADRTLDGMLAGELHDRVDGGVFRYAMAEDWTQPRTEKLLDVNAALLGAYAIGAHLRGRRDWRDAAARIVGWVDRDLALPDGLFGGSVYPDQEYFALDAAERAAHPRPPADRTVYTSWNAQWLAALADAGGRFDRVDWIERASSSLRLLLDTMAAPGDLLHHYRAEGGDPRLPILLADPLHAGIACFTLYQATGVRDWLDEARRLAHAIETTFWAEDGGFWDRARSDDDVGVLRYRDRAFESNADAARFLLDLAAATGERKYRALAERTLVIFSPQAGRYGVDGAAFALAVEEFFEMPVRIVITGAGADGQALRQRALQLPVAGRRVLTVRSGDRIGPLRFTSPQPAAFLCGTRGCSPPVSDPDGLDAALRQVS